MAELKENLHVETAIDFKALFRIIWKEKIIFCLIVLLFILLGGFYAFNAREEFTSTGKILPEIQSRGGGLSQFAGLASLAGVDLGNMTGGSDAVRPDLYPDVLKSTPFFLELLKSKIRTRDNKELKFEQYYHQVIENDKKIEDRYLNKFPVKENGVIVINTLNERRIKSFRARINASIDKKSGIITIIAKMPDPVVAADVTRFAMDYLTSYVTSYRTAKVRKEVDFLMERVAISRGKFYSNQEKKAQYSDQFQAPTIRLQSADVQRERLESEYRLSSNFYNELLKKLEEAKIRLNQETPVFKILEPPVVPTLKSEPKRSIILLIFTFLGGIMATGILLIVKGNYKKVLYSVNK